jgi:chromosome segregation ATPase
MANFENQLNELKGDGNKLYRERERLMRALEQKRNELKTYENNMGFFSFSSKSGNSMLKDLERKTQKIKDDMAMIEQKINLLDSKMD